MAKKALWIAFGLVSFLVCSISPLPAAKFPAAFQKNFRFEGKDAQAIAGILHLPAQGKQDLSLRLHSSVEWAAYLRDTPQPDASSSNQERPRYNRLRYDPEKRSLDIAGDWLDKNTGILISDLPRFYFNSPNLLIQAPREGDWWKLIDPSMAAQALNGPKGKFSDLLFQKKISLEKGGEFEIRIYSTWDYSGNEKKPALQVSLGANPT